MDMPDEPEAATEQWSSDVMHSDAEDSGSLSMSLQTSEEQLSTADASKQHPSAAGNDIQTAASHCFMSSLVHCQHILESCASKLSAFLTSCRSIVSRQHGLLCSTKHGARQGGVNAGLRPTVIAQTAAMMSANMGMDSDSSSSSDEEEPAPVKRHKGVF